MRTSHFEHFGGPTHRDIFPNRPVFSGWADITAPTAAAAATAAARTAATTTASEAQGNVGERDQGAIEQTKFKTSSVLSMTVCASGALA